MLETTQVATLVRDAIKKSFDLFNENRFAEAEIILDQVLKVDPDNAHAMQLLGLLNYRLQKHKIAIDWFQKAPACHENYNNLGLAYAGLGDFDKAVTNIKKAVDLEPHNATYLSNLGIQYRTVRNYGQAMRCFRRANRLKPDDPTIIANMGGTYGEMHILNSARTCFKKVIELDPNHAAAHIDLAYTYFLKGEFEEGWPHYEHRLDFFPQTQIWRKFYHKNKQWDGSPLNGRKLILYCEQGMGDVIQFARYIPLIDGDVTIHTVPDLQSLMSYFGKVFVCDIFKEKSAPEHDCHASIMSLPYLLKVPIPTEPYIGVYNQFDFSAYENHFKIGIVWAGNPQHPSDQERSCPLRLFRPLVMEDRGCVKLFSLQKDLRLRQYRFQNGPIDLADGCEDMKLVNMSEYMTDFSVTSSIIHGMDLIISVDTAVLHLAGAMGKKSYGLLAKNPDWRWQLYGDKPVWYPSIKLFRQRAHGQWQGCFQDLVTAVGKDVDAWKQNRAIARPV